MPSPTNRMTFLARPVIACSCLALRTAARPLSNHCSGLSACAAEASRVKTNSNRMFMVSSSQRPQLAGKSLDTLCSEIINLQPRLAIINLPKAEPEGRQTFAINMQRVETLHDKNHCRQYFAVNG